MASLNLSIDQLIDIGNKYFYSNSKDDDTHRMGAALIFAKLNNYTCEEVRHLRNKLFPNEINLFTPLVHVETLCKLDKIIKNFTN